MIHKNRIIIKRTTSSRLEVFVLISLYLCSQSIDSIVCIQPVLNSLINERQIVYQSIPSFLQLIVAVLSKSRMYHASVEVCQETQSIKLGINQLSRCSESPCMCNRQFKENQIDMCNYNTVQCKYLNTIEIVSLLSFPLQLKFQILDTLFRVLILHPFVMLLEQGYSLWYKTPP